MRIVISLRPTHLLWKCLINIATHHNLLKQQNYSELRGPVGFWSNDDIYQAADYTKIFPLSLQKGLQNEENVNRKKSNAETENLINTHLLFTTVVLRPQSKKE